MKPLQAKRAWAVAYDPQYFFCRWRKNMTRTAWNS